MTVTTEFAVNPPILNFKKTDEWDDVVNLPEFPLGMKVVTNLGNIYRFVSATAAKTAGLCYLIDEDYAVGSGVTKGTDDSSTAGIPHTTSSAPTAIGNSSSTKTYFWLQTGGEFASITPGNTVADGGEVASTGYAGVLDDGDDSGLRIPGAQWTAALSSGAGTASFWLSDEIRFLEA